MSALSGILHEIPDDIRIPVETDPKLLDSWNKLTPIQRNEWICWTITVKKPSTRAQHLNRLIEEIKEGKRQPCCWPGCPHRNPNATKWFKEVGNENNT